MYPLSIFFLALYFKLLADLVDLIELQLSQSGTLWFVLLVASMLAGKQMECMQVNLCLCKRDSNKLYSSEKKAS